MSRDVLVVRLRAGLSERTLAGPRTYRLVGVFAAAVVGAMEREGLIERPEVGEA